MAQVKKTVSRDCECNSPKKEANPVTSESFPRPSAVKRRRRAVAMTASRSTADERGTGRGAKRPSPIPNQAGVGPRIRSLDPLRVCGAATSVQLLFRVDEVEEQGHRTHLVFFDRHGWYCEHDRACPAVAQARAYHGQVTRGSRGASRRIDKKTDGGER